jgi:hypothetical protein
MRLARSSYAALSNRLVFDALLCEDEDQNRNSPMTMICGEGAGGML